MADSEDQTANNSKPEISEEDIQLNKRFERTWSARSAGFWGVSAIGTLFGAIVGAVAPFFPALAGAQTWSAAASLVPSSMAVFASTGMAMGFAAGGLVGLASGANVSMEDEQKRKERWQKRLEVKKYLEAHPELLPPDNRSRWQKLKDTVSTYVNPKVGAFFATVGMIGGAIMAAAYIGLGGLGGGTSSPIPAMSMLLGGAAGNATAVSAYFVGVMGTFGALWSLNFPKIVTKAQYIAGGLSSGRLLGTRWGPPEQGQSVDTVSLPDNELKKETAAEPARETQPAKDARVEKPEEPDGQEMPCACKHKSKLFASFQDMLAYRSETKTTEVINIRP